MPNPQMPTGFLPVISAYSYDSPDGVMRTDVAGGIPRYALEWDRGYQKFNVTLILNPLQFTVWTAFFLHVIKKGAITFDMTLDSGFGQSIHHVNIVPGSYSATLTEGTLNTVVFVVEAESSAYQLSAAEGQSLVDIYNLYLDNTDDLLAQLAHFATVDSNVLHF
jgi:hypothetical protein